MTNLALWGFAIGLCVFPLGAQVDLSALDPLGARAKESVEVNLDEAAIRLASGFLAVGSPGVDAAKLQNVLSKLRSISVRVLSFDANGQYTDQDLAPVRRGLASPGWARILNITEGSDHIEIYVQNVDGNVAGITVIAAEAMELAVASIAGEIDLEALAELGGNFGIPNLSGIPGIGNGVAKGKTKGKGK